MFRLKIDHHTRYTYTRPVSFGDHLLYLRPRDSRTHRVEKFHLRCTPDCRPRWFQDCFNNSVCAVNFGLNTSTELSFHLQAEITVQEDNPFDFILDPCATDFPPSYPAREARVLQPYLARAWEDSHAVEAWWQTLSKERDWAGDTLGFLTALNACLAERIDYRRRDEEGVQPPALTLARGTGSCRDIAALFLDLCRHLGLAGRFVSGYLHEPPAELPAEHVAIGSMHAWTEIYLPGAGWKGFDPTHGLLADPNFMPVAVATEADWINPIQGNYFAGDNVPAHMCLELNVTRMDHD